MARGWRATTGDGLVRWLLPASVLHAAAVLLAVLSSGEKFAPERASSPAVSRDAESSIELVLLDDAEPAPHVLPPGAEPLVVEPPSASAEHRAGLATFAAARSDARRGAEPSQPGRAPSLEVASSATPAPAGDDPSAPAHEPPRGSPALSLDQLGIGANPFLDVRVEPLTKAEQANARLQAALHPPSLERDRQGSLGPAGPVADAARQLVLADDGLVETSAVLNVRVDSAGHVTEIYVLEASSQTKAWQLIAARLAKALNPVALRRAESKQGWDMKLRLASSVQLPSGAAPGMRMGVLGQQVAGSGGPGSTSLELSPTSKLDLKEPIDSIGRHLDQPIQFEVMLLKFRADPADLGAPARRVVEVAVLSIDEPAAP